jgi:hypothetical protein
LKAQQWAVAYGELLRAKYPELPWRKPGDDRDEYKEVSKLFDEAIAKRLHGSAKGLAIGAMWAAQKAHASCKFPFFHLNLDFENPFQLILVPKGRRFKCARVKKGLAAVERKLKSLCDDLKPFEASLIAPFIRPSALIEEANSKVNEARKWLSEMHPEWKLARADGAFRRWADGIGRVHASAYVLDYLLRNFSEPKMKVREVEDMIADFENRVMAQNIAHDRRFGSEAVRQQVRKYRSDPERSLLDPHLRRFLRWNHFGEVIDEIDAIRGWFPLSLKGGENTVTYHSPSDAL